MCLCLCALVPPEGRGATGVDIGMAGVEFEEILCKLPPAPPFSIDLSAIKPFLGDLILGLVLFKGLCLSSCPFSQLFVICMI